MISDSPKITIRQEQERRQKAAPLLPREVFATLVTLSLHPVPVLQPTMDFGCEKQQPKPQRLPVTSSHPGEIVPTREDRCGELNEATEAVPAFAPGSQHRLQNSRQAEPRGRWTGGTEPWGRLQPPQGRGCVAFASQRSETPGFGLMQSQTLGCEPAR